MAAREELSRLSAVLGYVLEARDRLSTLCDDLVSTVLQAALYGDPGVGERVGEWARLLEDTARVLLVARELVRGYWGRVETR